MKLRLCAKSSLWKGVKALRLIAVISSLGQFPHGECYNQAGSDFYVN